MNMGDHEGGFVSQYQEAIMLVRKHGKCSASFIQRSLEIGYPAAAKLIQLMEAGKNRDLQSSQYDQSLAWQREALRQQLAQQMTLTQMESDQQNNMAQMQYDNQPQWYDYLLSAGGNIAGNVIGGAIAKRIV